eukprot:COSAG02_NODE_1244_length_13677_cov_50.752246_1_plen_169_part_00
MNRSIHSTSSTTSTKSSTLYARTLVLFIHVLYARTHCILLEVLRTFYSSTVPYEVRTCCTGSPLHTYQYRALAWGVRLRPMKCDMMLFFCLISSSQFYTFLIPKGKAFLYRYRYTFLLSYPQFINSIPFSYPVREKAFLYSIATERCQWQYAREKVSGLACWPPELQR